MKKSKIQKRIEKALKSIDGDEYWKWKILPSPIKLGLSDSNALGSRDFGNQPGQVTWEDWEEKVKALHPVRFFLVEELVPWFKQKYRKLVKDPIYWFKCNFLTKHKYHLIDIREPKTEGPLAYRYGWIDSDTKMVLALFTILNDFVREEMSHWYCPSEEEVQAEPHLINQRNNYLETKAIHYWYNVERKRQEKVHAELLHSWSDAKKAQDPAEHQLWIDLHKVEESNKEKEDEMLARLLKIRGSLWT